MALIAKKAWDSSTPGAHASASKMEEARSRLEQRFLDGGAVLLSVLDVLNKMIASLDALTGSLDENTTRATMEELGATAAALSGLAETEIERQSRFREIAASERTVRPHVTSMQETLRYLRTFAVTAKITGAGIPDFAGFAEEILQRIQEGSDQVNSFSGKLTELGTGITPVISKGEEIVTRYGQTVPKIIDGLTCGMQQLHQKRDLLGQRAKEVKAIARGVQNKLASVLSSLQIGDITRQRIEHCQSSFEVLGDYLASPDARDLTPDQKEQLSALVAYLVYAQLDQSRSDFDRDTGKIVQVIESFRSDLLEITEIQKSMAGEGGGDNGFTMTELEEGVSEARLAVNEIEQVATAAADMTKRTLSTVQTLLDGISLVQVVRGDIHYMALNTNLRCGKIGEEGKAINVVAAELRTFAGQLDDVADKVLLELKVLESAAQTLLEEPQDESDAEEGLDARLERALGRIHGVSDAIARDLTEMRGDGQRGIEQMNAALSKLDFQADLGEILQNCVEESRPDPERDISADGIEAAIAIISPRINKLYTMASERELHAAILGTAAPEEAPLTVLSDEDLDSALF